MSRPPPSPIAKPVSQPLSESVRIGPEVWKTDVPCATQRSACAKGVRRVRLRPLISGPARKLSSRVSSLKSCVAVGQGGVVHHWCKTLWARFGSKGAEMSPLKPRYLLTFPVTALVRGEADIDGLFVGVDFDPRLDTL